MSSPRSVRRRSGGGRKERAGGEKAQVFLAQRPRQIGNTEAWAPRFMMVGRGVEVPMSDTRVVLARAQCRAPACSKERYPSETATQSAPSESSTASNGGRRTASSSPWTRISR